MLKILYELNMRLVYYKQTVGCFSFIRVLLCFSVCMILRSSFIKMNDTPINFLHPLIFSKLARKRGQKSLFVFPASTGHILDALAPRWNLFFDGRHIFKTFGYITNFPILEQIFTARVFFLSPFSTSKGMCDEAVVLRNLVYLRKRFCISD